MADFESESRTALRQNLVLWYKVSPLDLWWQYISCVAMMAACLRTGGRHSADWHSGDRPSIHCQRFPGEARSQVFYSAFNCNFQFFMLYVPYFLETRRRDKPVRAFTCMLTDVLRSIIMYVQIPLRHSAAAGAVPLSSYFLIAISLKKILMLMHKI